MTWVKVQARGQTFLTTWETLTGSQEASNSMLGTWKRWKDEQGLGLGELDVDEDPHLFGFLIKYLTNCGQPGVGRVLPSNPQEREELRMMASRLQLNQLERLLTPPSDILGHYLEQDRGTKEAEDRIIRELSKSSTPDVVAAATASLIDPFDPQHHPRFTPVAPGSIQYPLLFTHVRHPTLPTPTAPVLEGDLAIVDSLEEFRTNLRVFTGGALEGLDWRNLVLAGGAALNCLMAVPPEYREGGDGERSKWLGPNTSSVEQGNAGPRPDVRVHRAKSGYGSSDVDLFIVGLSPEEATQKLNKLLHHICGRIQPVDTIDDDFNRDLLIVRTGAAVTVWGAEPYPKFQVILCCYSCPADVVMHFDLDCCGVLYDGAGVRVTQRAHRAITHRMNLVDPSKQSNTFESRLLKYAYRGFRVAVPGYSPALVDPSIFSAELKDLRRLAWLLARQRSAIDRCEITHLEGQRKRQRLSEGPGRPGSFYPLYTTELEWNEAPAAVPHDEELVMPWAICSVDPYINGGSDTSVLLPQHLVAEWGRWQHLAELSVELRRENKPQGFVYASWADLKEDPHTLPDPLLDAASLKTRHRDLVLGIPQCLTWHLGHWTEAGGDVSSGFQPVTADWTAEAYL